MFAAGLIKEQELRIFETGLKRKMAGIRGDVKSAVVDNLTGWCKREGTAIVKELADRVNQHCEKEEDKQTDERKKRYMVRGNRVIIEK